MSTLAEALVGVLGGGTLATIVTAWLTYRKDTRKHPPISPTEATQAVAALAAHEAGITPEALAAVVTSLQAQITQLQAQITTMQDTISSLREQLISAGLTPRDDN